jgi:hypothetical protein
MAQSAPGQPRHPGRSGADWNRVRALVLKNATFCAICGGELDFTAPPRSPWSPSVDHVICISDMKGADMLTQRRLALDLRNLRPVHYGCNARRGARHTPQPITRRTSRKW